MNDDIVLTITAPPGEAREWLAGEAYRYDLMRRLEAWIGEFGALEVATALAYAYACREGKRRGLIVPLA
jgi:hypothetical protein